MFESLYDAFGISQVMDNVKNWFKEEPKEEEYYPKEVTPIKYIYRPKTLKEYIGQERAKNLVEINLEKIKTTKMTHFVISGHKGAGKSTLANIIANELQATIKWYIGGAFTKQNLIDFLSSNQDDNKLNILFVDEAHNLEKGLAEFLYPIIEDFILPIGDNLKLKPFVFITATTDMNILLKKFAPLVDRCGANVILEPYTPKEIEEILKQYNTKTYQKNITNEVFEIISKNTRGTPRVAINFFDDFIVCKDVNRVLNIHRIVKDGLTTTDMVILKYLYELKKPSGLENLSMVAGISKGDYQYSVEPFLIINNYIARTSKGRIFTEKTEKLLNDNI